MDSLNDNFTAFTGRMGVELKKVCLPRGITLPFSFMLLSGKLIIILKSPNENA